MRLQELLESAMPIHYFAYGMLTDPEIMRNNTLVGVGQLRNFRLELPGFANVIPQPGSNVLGSLWIINRQELAELDKVEGYPFFYDRKSLPVYVSDKKHEAYVYVMRPDARAELAKSKPKLKYLKRIRNGYRHAGIPLAQLRNAQ